MSIDVAYNTRIPLSYMLLLEFAAFELKHFVFVSVF